MIYMSYLSFKPVRLPCLCLQADHLTSIVGKFVEASSKLVGGLTSSTGLVKDAVVTHAKGAWDIGNTAQDTAKSALDSLVETKAKALSNVLGKFATFD